MNLPSTYTEKNETGCCAVPNTKDWENAVVDLKDKKFIREYTKSDNFVPLNMEEVMIDLQTRAANAGATMPGAEAMILSRDLSPSKAEHLYAVSKPVEGVENVVLDGKFVSKVFEGPYSDAYKWHSELSVASQKQGGDGKENYLFYTTCPKCAEHYGKNYVIGLSRVA